MPPFLPLLLFCLVFSTELLTVGARSSDILRPWLLEGLKADKYIFRCDEMGGLNQHQRSLCKQQRDARQKLRSAAEMAHKQCMRQFRFNRWNCSLDSVLQLNASASVTKETSYVTAIGSAAIVHQIARACADGAIRACGCGVNNEYSTACNDNIKYGVRFARQYLDTPIIKQRSISITSKSKDIIRSAVNVHNNNAGRQLVEQTAKTKCACHGLSGACTTYTCYRQVSNFHEIGLALYRRYKEAVRVKSVFSPSKTTKLAFIDRSPDYCQRNSTAGIPGTGGRQCLPATITKNMTTYHELETCNHLCCGRGATVEKKTKKIACNCKFQWCCEVVCDECYEHYYEYKCNE